MTNKSNQNTLCEEAKYKTEYCMILIRETEKEKGVGVEREREIGKKINQNVKSDYTWNWNMWVIFIFFVFFIKKFCDEHLSLL